MDASFFILVPAFALVAVLYSSVGHGGASGYIAVMALAGLLPAEIKPLALCLNIAVSLVAAVQFFRAGHFVKSLFLPFALGAFPLSFLGGYLQLSTPVFNALMGLVLVYTSVRFFLPDFLPRAPQQPPFILATALGSGIGFLSGLVGVGGGIFLTPLLLWMGWADSKKAAAVSAPFIFLNSAFALSGLFLKQPAAVSFDVVWFVLVVLVGGYIGSSFGSRVFSMTLVRRLLSVVLCVAGAKLVFA